MVFLLQGQLDPLMPGQRKVNLKCQNPVDISGVRAKCIISYRPIQNWFCNVTCSEGVLGGSEVIVLLELVLTSRTSTVSACSSFASISTLGVAVISCCTGLSVLEMYSAAS